MITAEAYEFEGERFVKLTSELGGEMDVTEAEYAAFANAEADRRCAQLRADVAFWRDQQKFAASVAGNLADLNDYDGRVASLRKLLGAETERRKRAELQAAVLAYNLEQALVPRGDA